MNKAFNATAAGQKQMFYDSHRVVADANLVRMAELSRTAGAKDAAAGRAAQLPGNADYMAGYNEQKQEGQHGN